MLHLITMLTVAKRPLEDAQKTIELWRLEYNNERPHTALNNQTSAAYRAEWAQQQVLSHNR